MTLKPLALFATHRKYSLRYTQRAADSVQGIFTTKAGEAFPFTYRPAERALFIGDSAPISLNEYGWETNARGEVVFSSKK